MNPFDALAVTAPINDPKFKDTLGRAAAAAHRELLATSGSFGPIDEFNRAAALVELRQRLDSRARSLRALEPGARAVARKLLLRDLIAFAAIVGAEVP